VRLLRARGVVARLLIGYRPVPFLSHAWVEVEGRVVNDSPAYRKRLHVLLTA
jgi:transglutaminase superfamily protein